MVPKGLKVGDTFVDGGRTYVVEEVTAVGYISTADPVKVAKAGPKAEEKPKKKGDK